MGQWSGISDFFAMGGYAKTPASISGGGGFLLFYLRSVRAGTQKTESSKGAADGSSCAPS